MERKSARGCFSCFLCHPSFIHHFFSSPSGSASPHVFLSFYTHLSRPLSLSFTQRRREAKDSGAGGGGMGGCMCSFLFNAPRASGKTKGGYCSKKFKAAELTRTQRKSCLPQILPQSRWCPQCRWSFSTGIKAVSQNRAWMTLTTSSRCSWELPLRWHSFPPLTNVFL